MSESRTFRIASMSAVTVIALVLWIVLPAAGFANAGTIHCPPRAGEGAVKGPDCDGDGKKDWHFPCRDKGDGNGGSIQTWCIDKGGNASYFLYKHKKNGVTKYFGKCVFTGGKNKRKITRDPRTGKVIKLEHWSEDNHIPDPDKNYHDFHTTLHLNTCKRDVSYTGQDPTDPFLCVLNDIETPVFTGPSEPLADCCAASNEDGFETVYCDEGPFANPDDEPDMSSEEMLVLVETEPVAGSNLILMTDGSLMGEPVHFVYSTKGIGTGGCFDEFGGLCLDLVGEVEILGTAIADHDGVARLEVMVPESMAGVSLFTQAIVIRDGQGIESTKSTPLSAVVQEKKGDKPDKERIR